MPASQFLLRAVRTARPLLLALLLTAVLAPLTLLLTPGRAHASVGDVVIDEAQRHKGAPYVYGATGPGSFDCSGFTSYVYRRLGVSLPHSSSGQYAAIKHVSKSDKKRGDLVFTYDSGGIYHVGIYSGHGQMWAAPKTGDVVRKQTIWTSSYVVGRPVATKTRRHWMALGGARGVLGDPVTGERSAATSGARFSNYDHGSVYYSRTTGSAEVHGQIRRKYKKLDRDGGRLGLPLTDQHRTSDGSARYNRFEGGDIYASASTGAHEVHGDIRRVWLDKGGERSRLGLPTTDVHATPNGAGRYSRFEHGKITWKRAADTTVVKYF